MEFAAVRDDVSAALQIDKWANVTRRKEETAHLSFCKVSDSAVYPAFEKMDLS